MAIIFGTYEKANLDDETLNGVLTANLAIILPVIEGYGKFRKFASSFLEKLNSFFRFQVPAYASVSSLGPRRPR